MSVNWEPTTESQREADRIVYGTSANIIYCVIAAYGAYWILCAAVLR